tara:strand:+ start:232 stop:345 length:114 start_codon:yes stop_codon:yes gene_type:complete
VEELEEDTLQAPEDLRHVLLVDLVEAGKDHNPALCTD